MVKNIKKKKISREVAGAITSYMRGEFPLKQRLKIHYSNVEDSQTFFNEISTFPSIRTNLFYTGPYLNKYSDLFMCPLPIKRKKVTLEKEFRWSLSILNVYSEFLKEFQTIKIELDEAILLGEYCRCLKIIEQIKEKFGYSFLLLEYELLIGQLSNGLEGNKKVLSEIQRSNNFFKNIGNLVNLISEKYEDEFQIESLSEKLNELDRGKSQSFVAINNFEKYHLDKVDFVGFEDIPYILNVENTCSIIDLYETTMNLLIKIFINKLEYDTSKIHPDFINIIGSFGFDDRAKVIRVIQDPSEIISSQWHKKDLLPILDLYTNQKYEEVTKLCPQKILLHPLCFEFHDIYVKSIIAIENGREHKEIKVTETPSILNMILENLYNVIIKNTHTRKSLKSLKKIQIYLSNCRLGYCLNSFCKDQETVSSNRLVKYYRRQALLNTAGGTPRFSLVFDSSSKQRDYLKAFEATNGRLTSLIPYTSSYENKSPDLLANRENLYHAEYLLRHNRYEEAQAQFDLLKNNIELELFHISRVVLGLFTCYFKQNDFISLITLITNFIVNDQYQLIPIEKQFIGIYQDLVDVEWEKTEHLLDIVIISHYYNELLPNDDQDIWFIYSAYANLMDSIGIDEPLDLLCYTPELKKDKIIYLLGKICTVSVLEKTGKYKGDLSCKNYRYDICKNLMNINEVYQKEALDLKQELEVIKLRISVDKSKVYVDVDEIVETLGSDFENKFHRFQRYRRLKDELQNQFFYPSSETRLFPVTFEEQNALLNESGYEANNVFNIFKDIFLTLSDRFVNREEHGLNHYLSDRVRHGGIDLELWDLFENKNLVCKDDEKTFLKNSYWFNNGIAYTHKEKMGITKAIMSFSTSLKGIIDKVLNEWIQVSYCIFDNENEALNLVGLQREISKSNMFKYLYTDKEIESHLDNLPDVETIDELCSYVFDKLWQKTKHNLVILKDKIKDELLTEILDEIYKLEVAIKSLRLSNNLELEKSISSSRSHVEKKTGEIANWFQYSEEQKFNDYTVNVLLNTCLDILRNTSSDYFKSTKVIGKSGYKLPGKSFPYLVDAINILLRNIIYHSKDKMETTKIIVNDDEDHMSIMISNEISSKIDEDKLIEIGKQFENEPLDKLPLVSEQGMGLKKLQWIMNYKLKYLRPSYLTGVDQDNSILNCEIILTKRNS